MHVESQHWECGGKRVPGVWESAGQSKWTPVRPGLRPWGKWASTMAWWVEILVLSPETWVLSPELMAGRTEIMPGQWPLASTCALMAGTHKSVNNCFTKKRWRYIEKRTRYQLVAPIHSCAHVHTTTEWLQSKLNSTASYLSITNPLKPSHV